MAVGKPRGGLDRGAPLAGILFGQLLVDAAVAFGKARLTGDGAPIKQLIGVLGRPKLDFNIVEP